MTALHRYPRRHQSLWGQSHHRRLARQKDQQWIPRLELPPLCGRQRNPFDKAAQFLQISTAHRPSLRVTPVVVTRSRMRRATGAISSKCILTIFLRKVSIDRMYDGEELINYRHEYTSCDESVAFLSDIHSYGFLRSFRRYVLLTVPCLKYTPIR